MADGTIAQPQGGLKRASVAGEQRDFFTLDIAKIVFKDSTAAMEHPFFSLTTAPKLRPLSYEVGDAVIEIVPSSLGVPTVFDQDILIYCISQLVAAKEAGLDIGPKVTLTARDLIRAIGRVPNGKGYQRLEEGLDRLVGTVIKTTVETGGESNTTGFALVSQYEIVRRPAITGRWVALRVVLCDWLFRAVQNTEVLTLHEGYFDLRRPLERRLYEIARKHCGRQSVWKIRLDKLRIKSGSGAPLSRFRFNLKEIVRDDSLPGYRYALDETDMVRVTRKDDSQLSDLGPDDLATGTAIGRAPDTTAAPVLLGVGPLEMDETLMELFRKAARGLPRGFDRHAILAAYKAHMVGKPRPAHMANACIYWALEQAKAGKL